ncbi:FAD binding domain protein [Colletotrichum truncatum]|uniref:FAD binding domain protein n=1 Tax=Colletotrichum truncatum TaxID=5467 RepID=A0ACC3Z085_COLTU|nr:FAD binding domain protein [Colletotrichum truncatum]KAF6800743.1 FAD binding domain protein [Colletotrichum truncatum]
MATKDTKHQVIIVGGGITGLTLALMLQHQNVDYVLLEAYDSVTPNVGASIGLFPNGLRILDQLGLFEDILAKAQPVDCMIVRDSNSGERIMTRRTRQLITERHGYPSMFMERYQLLCVMYQHLKEKHRVFCNKKVRRVESLEHGALVHTEDGSVFEGQIVVGADGVRSTIRREMWRNADAANDSAAIPACDRQDIPCEHACIFGTAKPTPGIKPGEVVGASGHGTVAGCMGGPGGEVFVFWFWSLPKEQRKCAINDIPRFDDEDKRREFARGADSLVADNGLRFSTVADNLLYSGVTALPHYVMRKWHYGRLVIIGDAAHKFNPLVGQGGNSCIESCASLVNALQEQSLFGAQSQNSPAWPLPSVTKAFEAVENQRVDRLVEMVESCQDAMRSSAWESWRLRLMHKYMLPLLPLEKYVDYYSNQISGGLRLLSIDPPKSAHSWPYNDEKTIEEKSLTLKTSLAATIPVAALTAFFLARVLRSENGVGSSLLMSRIIEKVSSFRK